MQTVLTICGVLLCYLVVMALISTIKKKKDLGKIIYSGYGGLANADRSQFFISVACITFWATAIYRYGTAIINSLFMLLLAGMMVIFLILSLVQLNIVPGFYQKYVATGSSIFEYSDVTRYEIVPHKRRKGFSYVYINSGKGIFTNGLRILIQDEDIPEIKKYLKKKVKGSN